MSLWARPLGLAKGNVSIHALLGSSMPLMIGLIMVASRSTTNSKPSPDTRVTYLLGVCVVAMLRRWVGCSGNGVEDFGELCRCEDGEGRNLAAQARSVNFWLEISVVVHRPPELSKLGWGQQHQPLWRVYGIRELNKQNDLIDS